MGVADSYIKYLMFGINALVELAGLATLAVGVTWYLKVQFIVNLLGATNNLLSFIFMITGGVAAIAAFFGFFGAIAETIWMLIVFASLMILMLAGKIACVVWVYFNKDTFKEYFNKESFKEYFNKDTFEIVKNHEYSPEFYQWMFTSYCALLGSLEVMAMVFGFYLVNNIKRCDKKGKDEEKQDILNSDN